MNTIETRMGDGQIVDKCYFCYSTDVKRVNTVFRFNNTVGSFIRCNNCKAGHAIPYDSSYEVEN